MQGGVFLLCLRDFPLRRLNAAGVSPYVSKFILNILGVTLWFAD